MRVEIKPTDRLHMLVWRAYPSSDGDPGWRVSRALNGIPISFGERFDTGWDAIRAALVVAFGTDASQPPISGNLNPIVGVDGGGHQIEAKQPLSGDNGNWDSRGIA